MKRTRTFIIICEAANTDDLKVIHNYVKSFGYWAHITSSTWAVMSDEYSPVDIRNKIAGVLETGSRVLVVESANVAAWLNPMCSNEWLEKNI